MSKMLIDEIHYENEGYGHFVDTEEDLLNYEIIMIEKSRDIENDKTRKMINNMINHSVHKKSKDIERKILFIHASYLISLGVLSYFIWFK